MADTGMIPEGESNTSPDSDGSNTAEPPPSELSAADSELSDSIHVPPPAKGLWTRVREATGTVYGDIGTSVLYTVMEITRETIRLKHEHLSSAEFTALLAAGGTGLIEARELLGGLSLIFWALVVLTIKYDLLVMRADDRGEGGTFGLWGLLHGYTGKIFGATFLGYLIVVAGGLLAADGIITPPISMLGAFEPLGPAWSVIATIACLVVLFKNQWRGTSKVGGFFGWFMMLVWFPWIALKGIPWIFAHPEVFQAVNPLLGIDFLLSFPSAGAFVVIGVVVLAITGGEAKYADIGHFAISSNRDLPEGTSVPPRDSGRRPVTIAWFSLVLPCLLLNYAGQVGYMLERGVPPRANSFYALTPTTGVGWFDQGLHVADLVIATIAAFIASQALITGMFSITKQAIVLGFMPRFLVKYTSREAAGQVYLPGINWLMFFGCVVVTLVFQNAANLAAAYGIAVTGTMAITTLIFGFVAHYRWRWPVWVAILVCVPILAIDLLFFGSNMLKLGSGGYFPVLVASVLIGIMLIWKWGRAQISQAFHRFGVREGKKISWLVALRDMLDDIEIAIQEDLPHARMLVQGRRRLVESDRAAVFLCSRPIYSTDDFVPVVLRVFLKKSGALPSHIVLMHINQTSVPYANPAHRYRVIRLGHDIDSIIVTYGYLEQPNIRGALRELQAGKKIEIEASRWIIEVGEEDVIIQGRMSILATLRIQLFQWILRVSTPAHKFLGLVYDAALSKEIIPVEFGRDGAKVALPELEIQSEQAAVSESEST